MFETRGFNISLYAEAKMSMLMHCQGQGRYANANSDTNMPLLLPLPLPLPLPFQFQLVLFTVAIVIAIANANSNANGTQNAIARYFSKNEFRNYVLTLTCKTMIIFDEKNWLFPSIFLYIQALCLRKCSLIFLYLSFPFLSITYVWFNKCCFSPVLVQASESAKPPPSRRMTPQGSFFSINSQLTSEGDLADGDDFGWKGQNL